MLWKISIMFCGISDTYSELTQTSKIELFAKIWNDFHALTWDLLINPFFSLTVECTPFYMLIPVTK